MNDVLVKYKSSLCATFFQAVYSFLPQQWPKCLKGIFFLFCAELVTIAFQRAAQACNPVTEKLCLYTSNLLWGGSLRSRPQLSPSCPFCVFFFLFSYSYFISLWVRSQSNNIMILLLCLHLIISYRYYKMAECKYVSVFVMQGPIK